MQRIELIKDLNKSPNKQISYLQKRLVDWGVLDKDQIDGVFGDITENAVKLLQEKKNLNVTGIVDDETWKAIDPKDMKIPTVEKKEEAPFTLDEAVKLITTFEGLSLKAYRDPGSKSGLPITIGYGSTKKRDGSNFKLGDRLSSKKEAFELLMYKLETEFLPKLQETIPHWEKLNSNQKNALISFAYNCGAAFYGSKGFSTLSKYLDDQTYSMVPKAFMLYVKGANGKTLQGLVNRRQLEGQLFSSIFSTGI